jgi:uncharacterized protein (DUF433 family)
VEQQFIVKDPDILGGTPVFRGTRVPFQALLDYLEGGDNLDEFLDDFPTVSREAAIGALESAKSVLVEQLGGKSCSTNASPESSSVVFLGITA